MNVENGDDLASSQDGCPGDVPHPAQRQTQRLDEDFLFFQDLVDEKGDAGFREDDRERRCLGPRIRQTESGP